MAHRLLDSRAHRMLLWAAALVLCAACGKSASKNGRRAPSSGAGEDGGGQAGDPGSGGAAGTRTGGRNAGGGTPGGAGSGASGGTPVAGQGGSPGAGTSSGGTSGAGGSTGGADSIATPDGCTLTTHLLGGLFCSLEMTCDGERVLISCQEDSGDWRCGCVLGDVRPDSYYFPDLTGMRTCEVSAVACLHPELLDAGEVCRLTDDATSSSSCTATDTCVRSHEVEDITLETRSSWSASCELCPASSDACCKCAEGHTPDYRLVASDIEDGCTYLDELCRRSDDVTLGAGSCETLGESTNDVSCSLDMRCEYPLGLADGTTLVQPKTFQTHCTEYEEPEPVMHCRCTDEDSYDTLNVRFDPGAPDITRCRNTAQACAGVASLEPAGDLDCTEYAEPPSDRSCRRQRSCLQPKTLLGTAVETLSGALVDCYLQDDGAWSCSCFFALKGERAVTIEPDASDAESACAQAIAECPLVSRAVY